MSNWESVTNVINVSGNYIQDNTIVSATEFGIPQAKPKSDREWLDEQVNEVCELAA